MVINSVSVVYLKDPEQERINIFEQMPVHIKLLSTGNFTKKLSLYIAIEGALLNLTLYISK